MSSDLYIGALYDAKKNHKTSKIRKLSIKIDID